MTMLSMVEMFTTRAHTCLRRSRRQIGSSSGLSRSSAVRRGVRSALLLLHAGLFLAHLHSALYPLASLVASQACRRLYRPSSRCIQGGT